MVGSAVVRALEKKSGTTVLTQTRQQLDLTDPVAVDRWFAREKPEQVVDAAARVGGILENSRKPVEFLLDNLRMLAVENDNLRRCSDYARNILKV